MQTLHAQPAALSSCFEDAPAVTVPAFRRFLGFCRPLLRLRARDEADVAARYAGCGWNDAMERQMTDAIGGMHNTRM